MTSRYVLVIFLAQAKQDRIEEFRSSWDPLAGSIAAHITLVYPFESAIDPASLESIVASVAPSHSPFDVELADPTVHEAEYLFLLPRRGRRQIELLHRDLYDAVPDAQLEGRFVAHMTIGRNPVPTAMGKAHQEAVSRHLEVRGHATAVSAYAVHPDGSRLVLFAVSLGTAVA